MLGILYLSAFILSGMLFSNGYLKKLPGVARMTIGLALALAMLMWAPSLFAFAFGFAWQAHAAALLPAAAAGTAGVLLSRREGRPAPFWGDIRPAPFLASTVPVVVLVSVLLYTHTLRPAADGSLHVGQSTYGDLSLHVGIATGLIGQPYPPDYTILAGTRLGYPFLSDAMAASLMLFGTPVQPAFVLTALLMTVAVVSSSYLFFRRASGSDAGAVLAQILLYLNGGFGFAYSVDGAAGDPRRFTSIFTDYYMTPANRPGENVYWVNVICDSLIPQRTLLAGWSVLIPCLYLLEDAVRERSRRSLAVFTLLAGTLPMIHTHSFLALAVISAGVFLHMTACRADRAAVARFFLPCIAGAFCLSVPQFLAWTLPQSTADSVIRFVPGWVNNSGSGLKDETVWFYLKNLGPVALVLIPAALTQKRGSAWRGMCAGAAALFVLAHLLLFQRNPYDNNKLLLVSFIVCLPFASRWLLDAYRRLRGLKGRAVLAAAFMTASVLSGVLSIGRELVSDYELYSPDAVQTANWVCRNTENDCTFLSGTYFADPVSVLAGRHVVCGPDLYLYFHGFDTSLRKRDVRLMYEQPGTSLALYERYGIDYVLLSNAERSEFLADEAWFDAHASVAFEYGGYRIYDVRGLLSLP